VVSIGFVYVLLNPAFPRQIKIGRTARDPRKRAGELSRQTGVPDDFIVLYEELVGNAEEVEDSLHVRFAEYRAKRNKEFFQIPATEAIKALQQVAIRFPIPKDTPSLVADLLPHLLKYFAAYLDPRVVRVRLIQLPGICYLEVTRQPSGGGAPVTSREGLSLAGFRITAVPTLDDLRANEALVHRLDEYDWIMISDLFPVEIAENIARDWEQPGGKLEQERMRQRSNPEC
jgi:hypothetical protein